MKADIRRYTASKERGVSRDGLSDRSAQTINNALKSKEVQVSRPTTSSAGCQASTSDIYDTAELTEATKGIQALSQMRSDQITRRALYKFQSRESLKELPGRKKSRRGMWMAVGL